MTAVVLCPMVAAIYVACRHGFRHALVFVALPSLLLFPSYYYLDLPGLPEANFWNYTMGVVLVALVFGRDRTFYRFHWIDLLILALVVLTVYSEFGNKGYTEARNVFATQALGIAAPYLIGRAVGAHNGLLVGFLSAIAVGGAFIGFVSPYEARMGWNPFDFWRSFWPMEVPWDGALYRFGIRRVAGPFAHPICSGFFFSMSLPLVLWLRDRGMLRGFAARWLLPAGHVIGLLASGSRAPWLGTLLALTVLAGGWARSRALVAAGVVFVLLVGGPSGYEAFETYTSVSRGNAKTATQETAAYRKELLSNYMEYVEERPWIGHGRNNIPVVHGQKSIDNQYLFLALVHGLPAAYTFLACLLAPALLVLRRSFPRPSDDSLGRLGWALTGTLGGAIFTQITVFAGTQTEQILFLLAGLSVQTAIRLTPGGQHVRIA